MVLYIGSKINMLPKFCQIALVKAEHKPPSGLKTADGVLEALTLVSLL